jgi:hypothetical protein
MTQAILEPVELQALVDVYVRATYEAEGHATGTHAGIAAVLEALSEAAQRRAAAQPERYDHRSLYEFAASLHYGSNPRAK